jgi:hypothetical protein
MKKTGVILLAVLAIGLIITVANSVSTRNFMAKVKRIHLGDTKVAVERVLGRPVGVFKPSQAGSTNFIIAMLEVRSETWAYGPKMYLGKEFPYFVPFRLRMFRPDEDDVAIEFDSSAKVSKISIP